MHCGLITQLYQHEPKTFSERERPKLQLKAKDVVLDETEVSNAKAVFVYNHYDSGEGYYVTDAIKDIEGNVLTNADVCSRVKDGAQIYVQVVAASGSNTGKFQLLDKYEHEEHGGGTVVDEHFWSEGNAFNKYISMTFRLADNFVSAPQIADKDTDFVIDLTDGQEMFDFSNTTWTCTSFAYADLQAAIAGGKRIVIRSKNYLDNDNPTSNKMYLTPTEVRDSVGGGQVIMFIPCGSHWYSIGIAQTTNVTSLNVSKT